MDEARTAIRLALAQLNPTVGDIDANAALAAEWIGRARAAGADLVVLPELMICGYPPEDLLLKRHFLDACEEALEALATQVDGIVAMVGCPVRDAALHNGLAVIAGGRIVTRYRKVHLPNYGVFDERRYFEPGPVGELIDLNGALIGLTVCEDIWLPGPPSSDEAASGARLIVNASASPYHRTKGSEREAIVAARARESNTADRAVQSGRGPGRARLRRPQRRRRRRRHDDRPGRPVRGGIAALRPRSRSWIADRPTPPPPSSPR